jgi:hypothetical protein
MASNRGLATGQAGGNREGGHYLSKNLGWWRSSFRIASILPQGYPHDEYATKTPDHAR